MYSPDPVPFISVIVPTYQRDDLLAQCLDRLAPGAQTLKADYEVIVTDDGRNSTAETMIRRSYPWARWVAGPQRGPAANRNHGAGHARGEWLAFTDDDCLPDARWLAAFCEASSAAPEFLVFEGRVYADRPQRTPNETAPLNESGGYLWSCNILVKKALFDALKGFNEQFPYACMEDVEFRYRLTRAGHNFSFVPQASVCHPWRLHGGWKTLKQSQESMLICLKIHPEMRKNYGAAFYLKVLLKAVLQLIQSFLQMSWNGVRYNFRNVVNSAQMMYLVSR